MASLTIEQISERLGTEPRGAIHAALRELAEHDIVSIERATPLARDGEGFRG